MDVRDIRIGDCVKYIDNIFTIKVIEEKYVEFSDGTNAEVGHLYGIPLKDDILDSIGATYRIMTMDYIMQLTNGKQIILRPQMGDDNFIVTVKDAYTLPKRKITYLHDLQHYLWDVCKCTL